MPAGTAVVGAVVLCLATALLGVQQAASHAVMIKPQSRPWLDYLQRYNYLPHAVFAGGVKSFSDNGRLRWPTMRTNGLCGDAYNEKKWDTPGPVMATYQAGQVIEVDVVFAQNHLGRMQVRACPLAAKSERECRTLVRPQGRGAAFDLPWVKDWYGATSGFQPPVNTDGFKLYKMPPVGKDKGCAAWSCDQFRDMYVYSTKWQLPSDFKCEHCKLQFFYLTGSRCWPPCMKQPCKKPVPYAYCGTEGATYPEMFWNCADIRIK